MKAAKLAGNSGPSAPGSKPIPEGEPNCLAGLSFVFTGELSSLARDEAIDLAKRFGGRVVGQPSSVTSYVVLGENAGPAKLAAIKKRSLRTLDEDGFLGLIGSRKSGEVDAKTKAKMKKEEETVRKAAEGMEKAERKAEKERVKAKKDDGESPGKATVKPVDSQSLLWTTRYAPSSLKEICGNKGQVEKLRNWLHDWCAYPPLVMTET
jgi:replication factor C subunit 1